jgi:superfamily II DNA/RNA helicase
MLTKMSSMGITTTIQASMTMNMRIIDLIRSSILNVIGLNQATLLFSLTMSLTVINPQTRRLMVIPQMSALIQMTNLGHIVAHNQAVPGIKKMQVMMTIIIDLL